MPRRLAHRALALLLAAATLAACAPRPTVVAPADPCRPPPRAVATLREARNFLLVDATLNGQPAALLVDTGADITTLTPLAAAALRLPADPAHNRRLAGITGSVAAPGGTLHRLALGGHEIATDRSIGVSALPTLAGLDPPVAGLLGADVLAGFEVELDLPAGRMALYPPPPRAACPGWRPWPQAAAAKLHRTSSGLEHLDVLVDGRAVPALLDTGARTTLITRETAAALGVTAPMLAADAPRTGVGVGGSSAEFRRHRFATLGLPGAMARDVPVNIADLPLPGVDMLLGADFLGHRHVWISYSTSRLFLR